MYLLISIFSAGMILIIGFSGYLSILLIKKIFFNLEEREKIKNITGIYGALIAVIPLFGTLYFAPKYFIKKLGGVKTFSELKGIGIYFLFLFFAIIPFLIGRDMLLRPLISPIRVSGNMMSPNLKNQFVYAYTPIIKSIKRGDLLTFRVKGGPLRVGRVVGLPGETLYINNNKIYLSGGTAGRVELFESYLQDGTQTNLSEYVKENEFTIPQNSYFILGDNRSNSLDSRSCFYKVCNAEYANHYLNRDEIVGKIY